MTKQGPGITTEHLSTTALCTGGAVAPHHCTRCLAHRRAPRNERVSTRFTDGASGRARGCRAGTKSRARKRRAPQLSAAFFVLITLLLNGCSVTKYLPEGEYLYDGSSVTIEAPDGVEITELEAEVSAVLDQNTNTKIPLLGYYNIYRWYRFEEKLAEKPAKFEDKDHWGKEPIFYDEKVVERVNKLIENRAATEGYLRNESDWTLDTMEADRLISADFVLAVGTPYQIDSVSTMWPDSSVAAVLNAVRQESLLVPGKRYEISLLKAERLRWQEALRAAGYYYSRADDFIFLADTVQGDHKVSLLATLADDVPASHLVPQRIARINVFPNAPDRQETNYGPGDTTEFRNIHIVCADCPLRPGVVDEAFVMEEGDLYNPLNHRKTLERLADYNTFRYIAMEYQPVAGSGDSLLTLRAFMEPRLKRRFEGELGLTYNTADYFGPNAKAAYVNRNLLGGAELLRIEVDATYAAFLGQAANARVPNSGIYGLTTSLHVPRLWLPKRRKLIPRVFTSGTNIELGFRTEALTLTLNQFQKEIQENGLTTLANELEDDIEVTEGLSLQQFSFQYGYEWKRRVANQHALNPISIRFQNPAVSSEEVLDLAREVNLAPDAEDAQTNRFDRMLVYSPNYTITVDGRLNGLSTNEFFWQQGVSFNINNIFPVGRDADLRERDQSFYPLLETDFRHYLTLSDKHQIASRFHGGIAFPLFSDRAIVPYFDLFTIGGPNSLRGFAPRQLGPGRTVPFANNLLSSAGLGNLLVEGSLEYRYSVNSIVEVALFADAGNVWTYRTELEALDTDFKTRAFAGDVAVDAGVGLRFDLQFLIFRIDLAQPLQTPYNEAAEELVVPNENARDVPENNLRLNIAFGYPF